MQSAAAEAPLFYRRRLLLAGLVPCIIIGLVVWFLGSHWGDVENAVSRMPILLLAAAVLLQLVVIVARLEAWRVCLKGAGYDIGRGLIYGAGSIAFPIAIFNMQLGTGIRLLALRKIAPDKAPPLATMCAAEVPVWGAEAVIGAVLLLAAAQALGLPLWIPLLAFVVGIIIVKMLMQAEKKFDHHLFQGLRVLSDSSQRPALFGFAAIILSAQVARIWILLIAAGLAASPFDASAVLIGQGLLSQLPIGPTGPSGASVLVFGSEGLAKAAAAGLTLTVTEFIAGIGFLGGAAALLAPRLWRQRKLQAKNTSRS
jgi:hypothetical protein